jgi:hypothetical protein
MGLVWKNVASVRTVVYRKAWQLLPRLHELPISCRARADVNWDLELENWSYKIPYRYGLSILLI